MSLYRPLHRLAHLCFNSLFNKFCILPIYKKGISKCCRDAIVGSGLQIFDIVIWIIAIILSKAIGSDKRTLIIEHTKAALFNIVSVLNFRIYVYN